MNIYIGMTLKELDAMIQEINSLQRIESDGKYYIDCEMLKDTIRKYFIAGTKKLGVDLRRHE